MKTGRTGRWAAVAVCGGCLTSMAMADQLPSQNSDVNVPATEHDAVRSIFTGWNLQMLFGQNGSGVVPTSAEFSWDHVAGSSYAESFSLTDFDASPELSFGGVNYQIISGEGENDPLSSFSNSFRSDEGAQDLLDRQGARPSDKNASVPAAVPLPAPILMGIAGLLLVPVLRRKLGRG